MNGTAPITAGQVKDLGAALLQAIPTDMPSDVAQNWIGNKSALAKILREALLPPSEPERKPVLLEFITRVDVSGATDFVVSKKFREGKVTDGVKIAWLGDNFKTNFLAKVERGVDGTSLCVHKLTKASLDSPILSELGDIAETALCQFWELLKKQGKGEAGPLLTNGYANISYIRDANDMLWAVRAYWYSDDSGWIVGAGSVADQRRWDAGNQVVSR